jgi:hypothetical protein
LPRFATVVFFFVERRELAREVLFFEALFLATCFLVGFFLVGFFAVRAEALRVFEAAVAGPDPINKNAVKRIANAERIFRRRRLTTIIATSCSFRYLLRVQVEELSLGGVGPSPWG